MLFFHAPLTLILLGQVVSATTAEQQTEIFEQETRATQETQSPETKGLGSDHFSYLSDFTDTAVTFAISNVNVFASPGERLTPTSGYRIGVDRNTNLFLENVNTRYSGYETLSRAVIYQKLPAFWEFWETEVALAALVLADTDTGRFSLFDSGTYVRLIRKAGEGKEADTGAIDLTAWPVSADRFRLGYTYILSWGGTAIFPGKLQSSSITEGAVPGVRVRWRAPKGKAYAFTGFKSALLLSREAGVQAGEQVPNYGVLAGGGATIEDVLMLELNGGFFQKGTQEKQELEGSRIRAYGVSARVTLFDGAKTREESEDYKLYRNDPADPVDYHLFKSYKPGTGYSIALEGSVLLQNLADPDVAASEKVVVAPSAGLVAIAKIDEITLRFDAVYKSLDFILFNVPGFVPFQAVPEEATTSPEFFFAGTFEYFVPSLYLRPSLALGLKIPATYRGKTLAEQGQQVGGAYPGEVRTQVILSDTLRTVLPVDQDSGARIDATPIFGAVLKAPLALSPSTAVSPELRFELNDNQPRLKQEPVNGQALYDFDTPYRLSIALVLQSRW